MSRSVFVSAIFSLVIAILLIVYATPDVDGSGMSIDAREAYAVCIETGRVTNWHSALFMCEGVALRNVAALFGVALSGYAVIKIMAAMLYLLMCAGVAFLIVQLQRNEGLIALISLIIYGIIALYAGFNIWGLDIAFLCVLFALFASVVALYRAKRRKARICLYIISFFLMWHCVEYRKNSLLLMPWILFAIFLSIEAFRSLSVKRMILTVAVGSMVSALLFMLPGNYLFPVIRTHPIVPMMISDVKIAHILQGREDELMRIKSFPDLSSTYGRSITASYAVMKNAEDYPHLRDFYINSWKEYPKEMLIAKGIQIMQFYLCGKTPDGVRALIENKYQKLRHNPYAWRDYRSYYSVPCAMLIGRLLPFVIMAIVIPFAAISVKRQGIINSPIASFTIFSGGAALLYAASFMVITPTADDRYLMPSLIICNALIAVLLLYPYMRRGGRPENAQQSS